MLMPGSRLLQVSQELRLCPPPPTHIALEDIVHGVGRRLRPRRDYEGGEGTKAVGVGAHELEQEELNRA